MTAVVADGGRVVEHVAYTGSAGRKAAHYLGLYDALLGDSPDPRLGVDLADPDRRRHRGGGTAAADSVTWSEVTAARSG